MPSTLAEPTTGYADAVLSGDVIAGPHVRAACERHFRDLDRFGDEATDGIWWDHTAADKVIEFFPDILTLTGGEHEGEPFVLHDWEKFVVGSLSGWRKGKFRRFQVAFVETGKGSGKSPLGAGLSIYMTIADGEPRAESYMAAVDMEQAAIPFRDAVAMIKESDELLAEFKLTGGDGAEHTARHVPTGSWIKRISSESKGRGKSGYRPHFILLDEIHEHPTNAMVEFMQKGIKGRRQPLTFMITNSGVDRQSVCYEYHQYGEKVAAGDIADDRFFSYICALDEDDDPFTDEPDPELGYPRSWAKANPSIGVTFPPAYLEGEVNKARGMPSVESLTRRLNFCQWVDAASPWIDGDLWRACEVEGLELPDDRPLYLGLDLSGKLDLTAMAAVCPDGEGGFDAEVRFWSPGDTLRERENKDRVPYWAWKEAGHLNAPDGRSIDYAYVAQVVAELGDRVKALAFDPYMMEYFARELDNLGVPYRYWEGTDKRTSGNGLLLVRHGQGYGGGASSKSLWMPHSINVLEGAVMDGALRVRKNPVLTWNSASAVIETDAQANAKWEKRKSTGRIDGIVALSMALGAADVLENHQQPASKWLL